MYTASYASAILRDARIRVGTENTQQQRPTSERVGTKRRLIGQQLYRFRTRVT